MTTMTTSHTPDTASAVEETAPRGAASPTPQGWIERYRQAPPIYQWAIAIALGLILWMFAEDFIWSTTASWNEQNNRMERALQEGASRGEALNGVRDAIPAVGRIAIPRTEGDGSEELQRAVNEVLAKHKVDNFEWQKRPGGNMNPPPELVELVGPGTKLGKITGEVRFTSTQETVIKVIAGLEATDMIESISRLKMTKDQNTKKIGVTLTVEAWVQLERKSRGAQ